jgi:NAD(P)-dependent dehydrogenase (short-subunit alcohol dehydrogenase family)
MPQVVITGSSKGLGLALAEHFLSLGDSVIISSRDAERCAAEAARLASRYPKAAVCAFAADVGACRLKGGVGRHKSAVICHIYIRHI